MFLIRSFGHSKTIYYIHFEINGVSCNLIGSQTECDFSTNHTPCSAIWHVVKHGLDSLVKHGLDLISKTWTRLVKHGLD